MSSAPQPTCRKGHPWTPENTYVDPRGRRNCRRCRNAKQQARYDREFRSLDPQARRVVRHAWEV
jgi:hypothetical protein